MVLMHMTEKMNYKHSEVLSAVLTNRACHTLAVYFLLNKKMKRLSKEYRVRTTPVPLSWQPIRKHLDYCITGTLVKIPLRAIVRVFNAWPQRVWQD